MLGIGGGDANRDPVSMKGAICALAVVVPLKILSRPH